MRSSQTSSQKLLPSSQNNSPSMESFIRNSGDFSNDASKNDSSKYGSIKRNLNDNKDSASTKQRRKK